MAVYFTENRISWVYVQSLERVSRYGITPAPTTMLHQSYGLGRSAGSKKPAKRAFFVGNLTTTPLMVG